MKLATGQKKMYHRITLGWQSNRSYIFVWCLTIQVLSRFMTQRPCGSLKSHSTVWWSSTPLSLYVSNLHSAIPEGTLHKVFPMLWQSGVWATSWFWPPSSAPRRWGQQGMSWSGTWPCLTSVCVLSPCPWLWWERTRFNNLESKMQSYKWVISSQTYW